MAEENECSECDWKQVGFHILQEMKSMKRQLEGLATEMQSLKAYVDRRVDSTTEKVAKELAILAEKTTRLTERAAVTETKLYFIVAIAAGVSSVLGGLVVKYLGG